MQKRSLSYATVALLVAIAVYGQGSDPPPGFDAMFTVGANSVPWHPSDNNWGGYTSGSGNVLFVYPPTADSGGEVLIYTASADYSVWFDRYYAPDGMGGWTYDAANSLDSAGMHPEADSYWASGTQSFGSSGSVSPLDLGFVGGQLALYLIAGAGAAATILAGLWGVRLMVRGFRKVA